MQSVLLFDLRCSGRKRNGWPVIATSKGPSCNLARDCCGRVCIRQITASLTSSLTDTRIRSTVPCINRKR